MGRRLRNVDDCSGSCVGMKREKFVPFLLPNRKKLEALLLFKAFKLPQILFLFRFLSKK